jgi:serine/threonine protein kinase
MSDTPSGLGRDEVEQLLESFLARWRSGERPDLEEYAARCPARADEIRALFPALLEMEQVKSAALGATGPLELTSTAPDAATRPVPPHPDRLGDYRLLRVIGEGGMGVVYEAEHETLKSRVALKVMHARFRADRNYLRRFQTEARSAARLHHTNIVPVFDYGEQDGVCYYAMQYIAGVGLNGVLEDDRRLRADGEGASEGAPPARDEHRHTVLVDAPLSAATQGLLTGRFAPAPAPTGAFEPAPTVALDPDATDRASFVVASERSAAVAVAPAGGSASSSLTSQPGSAYYREIARLGAQVADALDYAHRQHVFHRDIKPSNLILDAQGNVWVTDFGLAKLAEGEDHSQSHDVVGTLRYMAPERFLGVTDRRTDIYALGATLYELLALRPAFNERDQVQLINQIVQQSPAPLRQHDHHIPHDLETVVLKVLSKDPKDRCDKAAELRDELRRFLDGRPTRWRRVGPVEQFRRWCKRNPWLAAANITAATLTTVLAIGSTIAAWIYRDQVEALRLEQRRTNAAQRGLVAQLAQTQKAERKARLSFGQSLLAEGTALQHTGLIGQRFDSLDRLAQAALVLRDDSERRARLAALRDQAIAATALTDLRPGHESKMGAVMSTGVDWALERYAVVDNRSGETIVRRMDDDHELARFPDPKADFWYASEVFSPDGVYLHISYALRGGDNLHDVWHLERRERVFRQRARSVLFHPDARRLVFNPADDGLVVCDILQRRELKRLRMGFRPGHISFDRQGRRAAAAREEDGKVAIVDLETGRLVTSWQDPTGHTEWSWSGDGRLLALGKLDGRVFVWDVERRRLASVLQGHTGKVVGVQFAPSGHLLATESWDGSVRLWNGATGELLVSALLHGLQRFSRDGHRLALTSGTGLGVWEVAHGDEVRTLNPDLIGNRTEQTDEGTVAAATFSHDGRLAALATRRGVCLYEAASGLLRARLEAGGCEAVLFHPDGRSLIT